MTKQINKRWQALLLAIIATFIVFGASGAVFAQNGIGKQFNARDPRPCSTAGTKSKAPTIAEATASVICNTEHEAGVGTLVLVEDLKVTQVGTGSPYARNGGNFADIDVNFLIYPIRGSFKLYHCSYSNGKTREKSCDLTEQPNATGRCYKNGFGQWLCNMSDGTVRDSIKAFPPGTAKAADTPVKDEPTTNNGNPTTDTPTDKAGGNKAERDENGFPKPDFSEMEKYFEIVRTDYEFDLGRFNFLVKAKKKTNIFEWYMTFYDADGIKVMDRSLNGSMGVPEIGEPTKIYGYTPTEREMKQVTKITITRRPS